MALINNYWLANHCEEHGQDPKQWPWEAKKEALSQATKYCEDRKQFELCEKYWRENGGHELHINDDARGCTELIWTALESDIVDQCEVIYE